MGTGGLGGFFGGWLAAAGEDVTFIARGTHLEAMRENGLTVTSKLGDRHVRNVQATDDPIDVGPVDIILFCVKNYSLEDAAEKCLPLLKPNTAIISVLNGIDAAERIEAIVGLKHAVSGVTLVPSNIAGPGEIAHQGENTGIVFGELDGKASPRLMKFRDACRDAGLDAQISPDITSAIWFKFIGWSSSSSVICANCGSFGELQSDPALIQLFRDTAAEAIRVGRASGASLPDDLVEKLVDVIHSFPPEAKPSMLVDLEQNKPIELDSACGAVTKLGEALSIETPINRALYAQLASRIDG
ncbi:2-dehydropantoate 2-reductase [Alisedimentitalea sp. MJ-SS2]|uniref:ketopantoate reductase family protein n=1 Tax=Aliisedimentitalea sp. MJ-SS2 TaxID=3049795 RepID=UPI00290F70F7|nr:2-dehydropantoate 2-reductase [Alisedimentitalea sp. MJ-SS2]MDU8927410.1 2-dehydropantoate 2-reductase [Alisedimentitalea sp. MJ-SS2]